MNDKNAFEEAKETDNTAVKGVWQNVHVFCANHGEHVPLVIRQNEEYVKTPFYACPDCANRLNLDDYEDIVLKLLEMIAAKPFANFENFAFPFRGKRHAYMVKISKYSKDKIYLDIRNTTILGK